MKSRTRFLALAVWSLAALLFVLPALHEPAHEQRARLYGATHQSPLDRLLGPLGGVLANFQWIRHQRAVLAGQQALAIQRAESALRLAPHETGGWNLLASHLGLFLASVEREPDPVRRLAWLQAALEIVSRGERQAREPQKVAFLATVLLLTHAEQDPELPWPGGTQGLWRAVVQAAEHAAELGHPAADLAADYARERLGHATREKAD